MYKVLLLTDFSPASHHTLAFAQTLLADTATQFCLLHAFQIEPSEGFDGSFLPTEQHPLAEESLREMERATTQQPTPACHTYRTLAMAGDPVSTVETLLAGEHFDLVVVGATGVGRTEFFGSVATGLIRVATTNVLVVPVWAPIQPLKQVVLATDYRSVNDVASFALLTDIVRRTAAQLTLLTIEPTWQEATFAIRLSHKYLETDFKDLQTDIYRIQDNDIRHGINAYLDTHAVGLFVVLPHHKGLFDALQHKSISRSLAYHPRVPLLALYDPAVVAPVTASESNPPADRSHSYPAC